MKERSYGGDCRLWLPQEGLVNWKVIKETVLDEFVVAHTIGWWCKVLPAARPKVPALGTGDGRSCWCSPVFSCLVLGARRSHGSPPFSPARLLLPVCCNAGCMSSRGARLPACLPALPPLAGADFEFSESGRRLLVLLRWLVVGDTIIVSGPHPV